MSASKEIPSVFNPTKRQKSFQPNDIGPHNCFLSPMKTKIRTGRRFRHFFNSGLNLNSRVRNVNSSLFISALSSWFKNYIFYYYSQANCISRGKSNPLTPLVVLLPPCFSALNTWRTVLQQCSGSMTFWCGSADPCLWLMDPDPDPAIFVIGLQDDSKNLFKKIVFCLLLFEGTYLHNFPKIKIQKEVTKQ